MATTWYLRDTNAATGPTGKLSTDTDYFTNVPSDKNTPKDMDVSQGAGQTSTGGSYNNAGANRRTLLRMFVSPELAGQSLTPSQALSFGVGYKEGHANQNMAMRYFVYVWRSGSGNVKTIYGPGSATEHSTAEVECVLDVTTNSGAFTIVEGDRIVVEVWLDLPNTRSTAYTGTFYYDGTDSTMADGTATSDAGSYVTFDQTFNYPAVTRNLTANIAQGSSTPTDVSHGLVRDLVSNVIQGSTTPTNVSHDLVRGLSANVSQGSTTPDNVVGSAGAAAITGTSSFDHGHGHNFVIDGNNVEFDVDGDGTPVNMAAWFYVKLSNVDGTTPAITINGINTSCTGMRPVYSYDQITWVDVASSWDGTTLTFSLPAISGHADVWVACHVPYSYADYLADIAVWDDSPLVTLEDLGDSQGGRPIYYLKINDSSSSYTKAVISITARTHPGEPTGSWLMKGMIDWLIGTDDTAKKFRKFCTFHIFPMVNPDGVYAGRNRAFNSGQDANRNYDESGPDAVDEEAETYLIHTKIDAIQDATPIQIHLDLHGSLGAPNVWRDSSEFASWLEVQIESNLVAYDTAGFWTPTFQDSANGAESVDTTYRDGLHDQYGIESITLEGMWLGYGSFGFPNKTQLQAGGVSFLKSVMAIYTYNDFSGLSSLVNLWDFESGALGTDSGPGSDDLTTYGGAVAVANRAPHQKVGSYALDVQGSDDAVYILDDDLSANHPWKEGSSGDWTIFGWVYLDSIVGQRAIGPQKYSTDASYLRSILPMKASDTDGSYPNWLGFLWGNATGTGYAAVAINSALTFAAGRWYHVQIKYDESPTPTVYARIWDDVAKAYKGTGWYSATPANAHHRTNAMLCLGATGYTPTIWNNDVDGQEDEWGICNALLSDDDLDAIKDGLLGVTAGGAEITFTVNVAQPSSTPNIASTSVRDLLSVISQGSSTPVNVSHGLIRSLLTLISQGSTTPTSVSHSLTRALLANIIQGSTTPTNVAVPLEIRSLIANVVQGSTTPTNVSRSIARFILAVISQGSTTSSLGHDLLRSLLTNIPQASTTPSITISMAGIINFIANIIQSSSTPGINQSMVRALIANIPQATTTPGLSATLVRNLLTSIFLDSTTPNIGRSISRALLSNISQGSITPNITATISGIISLIANIAQSSTTPVNVSVTVLRKLVSVLTNASTTPNITATMTGLISLLANILQGSSTPGIAVSIQRSLFTTLGMYSTTSNIIANIIRILSASVSQSSTTPNISISMAGLVNLIANIVVSSTTPGIAQTTLRSLSTNLGISSLTPSVVSTLARTLLSSIGTGTVTPSILASISRALLGNIASSSITPLIAITITGMVNFIVNIIQNSSTPGIAVSTLRVLSTALSIPSNTSNITATSIRKIQSVIPVISLTPGVNASLARYLLGSIPSASVTPSIVYELVRELIANIISGTSTSSIVQKIDRNFSSVLSMETLTSDAQVTILRQILANIPISSLTPDNLILLMQGLGVIHSPTIEPIPILREMTPLTPERTFTSVTRKRTIHNK